jgi:hypothetical protein
MPSGNKSVLLLKKFLLPETMSKKRKLTSLEINAYGRGCLTRLVRVTGWTKTRVLETALADLDEKYKNIPKPIVL